MSGKFPITILVTLILQTITAVWWASGLTTTVNKQEEAIKELKLSVTALTSAKVVVLESEVARLQAELTVMRLRRQ